MLLNHAATSRRRPKRRQAAALPSHQALHLSVRRAGEPDPGRPTKVLSQTRAYCRSFDHTFSFFGPMTPRIQLFGVRRPGGAFRRELHSLLIECSSTTRRLVAAGQSGARPPHFLHIRLVTCQFDEPGSLIRRAPQRFCLRRARVVVHSITPFRFSAR